jgi:F0F1-type ATP synthase membrane subunit b/b'
MSTRISPQRWRVLATAGVTTLLLGAGLGVAAAADDGVGTVSCPTVDIASLGAVPASAEREVEANLAQLNNQIAEANNRLRTSVGEGGANFVRNAILGPLADKRTAAINRIATAIGRQGVRPSLNVAALSACAVVDGGAAPQPVDVAPGGQAGNGGAGQGNGGAGNGGNGGQGNGGAGNGGQGNGGQGNGGNGGQGENAGGGAAVGVITCPGLAAAALGTVPASARAEVERNLALLQTQIAEANNRLRTSVGQGGANFVRNAILGPLASKRTATINRIATAIGRQGVRPNLPVAQLSECSVTGG